MYGRKDVRLLHARARCPYGRLDQQQDAVIAHAGVLDVVTERDGQQRDDPLAQKINFTRPRGKVGDGRALGQRRRAVGVMRWQRGGR